MRRAVVLVGMLGCASSSAAPSTLAPLVDDKLVLLVTPAADHQPFATAIDGAATSVDLAMYHLTDDAVAASLIAAAKRGVTVRVLLDAGNLKTKAAAKLADALRAGGVAVHASSAAFSITHEKAMVVDGATTFITAINLTRDVASTRDFGVVTTKAGIAAEVDKLFDADWHNAEAGGHDTPALAEPSLVVGPRDAEGKLVTLIASAKTDVIATVENLGHKKIVAAFEAATARGVTVRFIVPMCDKNPNPALDYAPAVELAAHGASVRMMPAPESAAQPYMHSKMIQVDGGAATYVGSENFSTNSLEHARELGVIFANAAAAKQVAAVFDADWAAAVAVPADAPRCGR
nr:phospholipase D-like domain-containing protein [Kofleriaceae bacterium]